MIESRIENVKKIFCVYESDGMKHLELYVCMHESHWKHLELYL